MATIEEIRRELSGEDRFAREGEASHAFALAVNSFTRWPVDAWAGERDEQGRFRTLYWLKGNTIGYLKAQGDGDDLTVTGQLQPVSAITTVDLTANVSLDDYHLGYGRRAITIRFSVSEINIDVERVTGFLRVKTDQFIDALLDKVSRDSAEL